MKKEYSDIILSLGSNLGDREFFLYKAISKLQELELVEDVILSTIVETKALLKEGSPQEWDLPYLNMAIKGKTALLPTKLLSNIQHIEKLLGRVPSPKWAPREIDIDILLYNNKVIETQDLVIPHRELLQRPWCLSQIAELYPTWKYPVDGEYYQLSAAEIIKQVKKNLKSN